MDVTRVVLSTGGHFDVQGSVDEIEALLVAAARGARMELARFTDATTGESVRISAAHVAAVHATAS